MGSCDSLENFELSSSSLCDLNASCCRRLTDHAVQFLLTYCTSLHRLMVCHCDSLQSPNLDLVDSSKLSELLCHYCLHLKDGFVDAVRQRCPELVKLGLVGCVSLD